MDAAKQSGNFIMVNMKILEPENGIAALNAISDEDCHKDSFVGGNFRLNDAGIFLDGLSVLPWDTQLNGMAVNQM
jgi:hypothetical protein